MDWIDDEGRLLGRVNVIDAFVFLGFLAIVASGIAISATGSIDDGPDNSQKTAVTVEVDVTKHTTAALENIQEDREEITDVRVTQVYRNDSEHRRYDRIYLTIVLEGTVRDGAYYVDRERIAIGQPYEVDAGRVVVEGRVIRIVDLPEER